MNHRRDGKISKFGIIALGTCALLLLLFLRPRSGPVPLSQLPAGEQERRRADVQKLEEEAKGIGEAAKQKKNVRFRVTVSEEQLNTMLQERLKPGNAPIHNVQATLSPGVVNVTGTVDYKGTSLPASLSGTLKAQNGKVTFQADSLSISHLPAPGAIKDKVESDINQRLSQGLTEAPLKVEELNIEQGKLTIAGTTD